MEKDWILFNPLKDCAKTLAKELNISPITAQLLINRDITTPDKAKLFFRNTGNYQLYKVDLPDIKKAIHRINTAIHCKEKIAIFTDYDADGIISAVILHKLLEVYHANYSITIPERRDGYGLNMNFISNCIEKGISLIITADCGSNNEDLIYYASMYGIDVIVTDHHEVEIYPTSAIALVNPKRKDSQYPFKELCGAGVVYKLALSMQKNNKVFIDEISQLVTIATIADSMPLLDENRTIIQRGLNLINSNSCMKAIKSILTEAKVKNIITAEDISFQLAPRINATGRISSPTLAYELLISNDESKINNLSHQLNDLNKQRRVIEKHIFYSIEKNITSLYLSENKIIVYFIDANNYSNLSNLDGVIGIIAGRLLQKYNRPTIIFTNGENEFLKGSARSLEGFNLIESFNAINNQIYKFGGHQFAAGIQIYKNNLNNFTKAINEYAAHIDFISSKKIAIESFINPLDITADLLTEINQLGPFGEGNPKPIFGLHNIALQDLKLYKETIFAKIASINLPIIAFRCKDSFNDLNAISLMDIAFSIGSTEFKGDKNLQLILEDFKIKTKISILDRFYAENRNSNSYKNIGESQSFNTKIVGVSFAPEAQKIIPTLSENNPLLLIRDPYNPYDANAIKVVDEQNHFLGYIRKDIAAEIAPNIDNGIKYNSYVTAVTGGNKGNYYGLNIFVYQDTINDISTLTYLNRKYISSLSNHDKLIAIHKALLGEKYNFRDKQCEGIHSLDLGKNTLIIFGTGRGKSVVFQTKAATTALIQKKKTIILYPLRALANDQYFQMTKKFTVLGLNILKINGSLNPKERLTAEEIFKNGNWDIAITTPEFLACNKTLFKLQAKNISFLVIDEAHHIAESSKSRPAYTKLKTIINELAPIQICAATATADDNVTKKIVNELSINSIIIDNYCRMNLSLIDKRNLTENEKLEYLKKLLSQREKTIVYSASRNKAMELAILFRNLLPYLNQKIAFYHGELSNKWRITIEKMFKNNELSIIFATSAFGEGIDLPDIKHVVLYHGNSCFTEFNQEAGRAGRNGEQANIHLLYNDQDFKVNDYIISSQTPALPIIRTIYRALLDSKEYEENTLPFTSISNQIIAEKTENSSINDITVTSALRILEDINLICRDTSGSKRIIYLLPKHSMNKKIEDTYFYQEGLQEIEDFKKFKHYALNASAEDILYFIQTPIIPIINENFFNIA